MAQPPEKSDDAFRTIREVADWLVVPTHVLRFWESKFDMIAPVKGAGGRRYYRPEDMRLLGGIKVLLHDQGLTIRGVTQRIEAEGVEALMALSPELGLPEEGQPRSRRVIRSDGEDEPRVVPFQARPDGPAPARQAIRREAGEDDAGPNTEQPDDDPMPPQPVDTSAPPQPDDGDLHAPRTPPQPVDDPSGRRDRGQVGEPRAPERRGPSRDDDGEGCRDGPGLDPENEPRQLGEPSPEEDADGEDAPPSPSGLARATIAPGQRRRVRRVLHRLRGMIEDLERDLSDGVGR